MVSLSVDTVSIYLQKNAPFDIVAIYLFKSYNKKNVEQQLMLRDF